MVGIGEDGPIPDYRGVVCAPWPNRVAGGRYSHGGRTYQAVINEPRRNTALHGLVLDVPWTLLKRTG